MTPNENALEAALGYEIKDAYGVNWPQADYLNTQIQTYLTTLLDSPEMVYMAAEGAIDGFCKSDGVRLVQDKNGRHINQDKNVVIKFDLIAQAVIAAIKKEAGI